MCGSKELAKMKWEYDVRRFVPEKDNMSPFKKQLNKYLNDFGVHGWELVFKRLLLLEP